MDLTADNDIGGRYERNDPFAACDAGILFAPIIGLVVGAVLIWAFARFQPN